MSNCTSGCSSFPWNGCAPWDFPPFGGCSQWNCPYSRWLHPICCNPAYYSCAGSENGGTLVIHQIVLEVGGEQSCTPRTFQLRITGPSYPCGEVFTLRAGSCLELDEPLVISGLEAGQYRIEQLWNCGDAFISTFTGPVCDQVVTVTASAAPTVVTIVSRRQRFRRCGCASCGCSGCSSCRRCGCSSCN